MGDIAFGFQAAPASDAHKSDQALYREVMDDCALGQKLGFDAAWLLEHHFSDYYPTPSPLLFMAHIAAAFPDLSLGTTVLVLPRSMARVPAMECLEGGAALDCGATGSLPRGALVRGALGPAVGAWYRCRR